MAWSVAAGYRADDPTSTLSAVLPAGRKQRKHHRYLPAEDLRKALAKVDGSGAWIGTRLAMRYPGADGGAERRGAGSEVARGRLGVGDLGRSGLAHQVPQGAQGSPLRRRACGPQAGRWTARSGSRSRVPRHSGEDGRRGRVRAAAEGPGDGLQPARFRSSFRSWCSDEGIDRELAEQALAHAVGSQVEQCYARSECLERPARGHGVLGGVPGR